MVSASLLLAGLLGAGANAWLSAATAQARPPAALQVAVAAALDRDELVHAVGTALTAAISALRTLAVCLLSVEVAGAVSAACTSATPDGACGDALAAACLAAA